MARLYAAILALVGMSVVLARACLRGAPLEPTITSALLWMAILGAVGSIVGSIADATVADAVRLRMEQELAAEDIRAANK